MNYVFKDYCQVLRNGLVSILLLAGLMAATAAAPAWAVTGTPYGSGGYNGGSYNGTTTGGGSTATVGAPNTGAGMYSPEQTTTKTNRTVDWAELGGGVLLIAGGTFWFVATRKRRPQGEDS